jgi:hypothetical protein
LAIWYPVIGVVDAAADLEGETDRAAVFRKRRATQHMNKDVERTGALQTLAAFEPRGRKFQRMVVGRPNSGC